MPKKDAYESFAGSFKTEDEFEEELEEDGLDAKEVEIKHFEESEEVEEAEKEEKSEVKEREE